MATLPVKFYMSSDAGAPVLKGAAGELRAVLDACLLTGFNVRPLRGISTSGGVARLILDAGHGFKALDVVKLGGALPVDSDGEYRVTAAGVDFIEFSTSIGITFQAGATVRRAPLNWVRGFGSGNKVSYKSGMPDSSGCHLFIDDSNTVANTTTENWKTKIAAFERMSSIDVGENKFADGYWVKGTSLTNTVTEWAVFGDEYIIYVFINAHTTKSLNAYAVGAFGDIDRCQNAVKKICVCNVNSKLLTQSAYNYIGANQRFASPGFPVNVSRGYLEQGIVGNASLASRVLGGASIGANKVSIGPTVARDDFLSVGVYTLGRSPGFLYITSSPPPWFSIGDGRYFCMPCISDTLEEGAGDGVSAIHVGSVFIDIIGPWR